MAQKVATIILVFSFLFSAEDPVVGATAVPADKELEEYNQELARIDAMASSLSLEQPSDLAKYEAFADEIQQKWRQRDKEQYAGLMLAIRRRSAPEVPITIRRCDLVRKYAQSAFVNRDAISLALELDLASSVSSAIVPRLGTQDEKFPAQKGRS